MEKENRGGWRGNSWRIAAWSVAVLILLLPLIAMQFSDEVKWGVGDFVFAALLIFGTGTLFEVAVRKMGNIFYRLAVAVTLAAMFMLVWINLAVGIIGDEGAAANYLYFGVLAIGIVGALLARFQPLGMARALFVMAGAQALVGVVALIAKWGATGPMWPLDMIGLTGFFVVMFGGSALLFQKAARSHTATSAG